MIYYEKLVPFSSVQFKPLVELLVIYIVIQMSRICVITNAIMNIQDKL